MNSERIEDMLSQLIRMVGSIQSEQQVMKKDIQDMKSDMDSMRNDMDSMKSEMNGMKCEIHEIKVDLQEVKTKQEEMELKNERRHIEVLKRLKTLEIDQDFTWEKTVRNERDIEMLKNNPTNTY